MSLSPPSLTAQQILQDLQTENARLLQIIQLKDEHIKLLNFRLFGPRSEKLSSAQMPLLLAEISLTTGEVETEAALPEAKKQNPLPKAKKPRPNHPGREKLPVHLERREEVIPCCPADCTCSRCGAERPVIGYEPREELVCEPATFWVKVIKREKRGSHCLEEQGVVTAAVPAQIIPKSKLSNPFIIEVLVRKYQQHLPVYRQCAALAEDHGIELSRKTLTDAILAAGALSGRKSWSCWPALTCKPTRRRCPVRREKRAGATTGRICGNTASRAGWWSLTFAWVADGKDRGNF
jgi:transposase